jgi:molecular chaperone GrpE
MKKSKDQAHDISGNSESAEQEVVNQENEVSEVEQAADKPQEEGPASPEDELETLRQQADEYFEGWQRERADFNNYKKRIERDQKLMTQSITGGIIKKYLAVQDDMERALKTRPKEGEGAAWAEGIDLILRKLQNILESEGIQQIPADDLEFNPNIHEAISHEDSPDHESGQIIEIVQQGYTIGDRVLRPALVRVAR